MFGGSPAQRNPSSPERGSPAQRNPSSPDRVWTANRRQNPSQMSLWDQFFGVFETTCRCSSIFGDPGEELVSDDVVYTAEAAVGANLFNATFPQSEIDLMEQESGSVRRQEQQSAISSPAVSSQPAKTKHSPGRRPRLASRDPINPTDIPTPQEFTQDPLPTPPKPSPQDGVTPKQRAGQLRFEIDTTGVSSQAFLEVQTSKDVDAIHSRSITRGSESSRGFGVQAKEAVSLPCHEQRKQSPQLQDEQVSIPDPGRDVKDEQVQEPPPLQEEMPDPGRHAKDEQVQESPPLQEDKLQDQSQEQQQHQRESEQKQELKAAATTAVQQQMGVVPIPGWSCPDPTVQLLKPEHNKQVTPQPKSEHDEQATLQLQQTEPEPEATELTPRRTFERARALRAQREEEVEAAARAQQLEQQGRELSRMSESSFNLEDAPSREQTPQQSPRDEANAGQIPAESWTPAKPPRDASAELEEQAASAAAEAQAELDAVLAMVNQQGDAVTTTPTVSTTPTPSEAQDPESDFVRGTAVRTHSFSGSGFQSGFNGLKGICRKFDRSKKQWQVKVDNGELMYFKTANLQLATTPRSQAPTVLPYAESTEEQSEMQNSELQLGVAVRTHSHRVARFNGLKGTLQKLDRSEKQWRVELESGEFMFFETANLQLATPRAEATFEIGQRVEVRDNGEASWRAGTVSSLAPLKVCPLGWEKSFLYDDIRPSQAAAIPTDGVEVSSQPADQPDQKPAVVHVVLPVPVHVVRSPKAPAAGGAIRARMQAYETACLTSAPEPPRPVPKRQPAPGFETGAAQPTGPSYPRLKLYNITEQHVMKQGVLRMTDELVHNRKANVLDMPKDTTPKMLASAFLARLLSAQVEFKSCMEGDVCAAQSDVRHLSPEQLLTIRSTTLDLATDSSTHSARTNFLQTVDKHMFNKLALKCLPENASVPQKTETVHALGLRLALIIGARDLLQNGNAWNKQDSSGSQGEVPPPANWVVELSEEDWPDQCKFAVFNTTSFLCTLLMGESHEFAEAVQGESLAVIRDRCSGTGGARMFNWDVVVLDAEKDDVLQVIADSQSSKSAMTSELSAALANRGLTESRRQKQTNDGTSS